MKSPFSTALRIYAELSKKPATYTQLKNQLTTSEASISLALKQLKEEDLVEKIIVNDETCYTITKGNLIETIQQLLVKKKPTTQDKNELLLILLGLWIVKLRYPSHHTLSYHFLLKNSKLNLADLPLRNVYSKILSTFDVNTNILNLEPYKKLKF